MIIYGATLSPFVRKVMAMGAEKGMALDLQPGGMGGGGPAFEEASPFRKMPALRDGDFTLCDSSAIAHYLDAVQPDPAMIPAEAKARATVVWYDEFADTILASAGSKIFFNRLVAPRFLKRDGDLAVADAALRDELPPIFAWLESVVPVDGFLVGDGITLADISVASPFVNLMHVGVGVDAAAYPKLVAYVARVLARPSFADMIAGEKAMVAAVGGPV